MKCPNCNSENVSFISNVQKRGFSVADACCGWLLFHNWIGILCGAIGANKTKTQDYWVCNNCGRKFQAKQMQKYNQQFINQEASVPQIEERKAEQAEDVMGLTDPKTYVERTASYSGSLSADALIKRAMLYLEDGEWEKAYEYAENALDVDAECAEAYLAKFLAEYNINSADDIPSECEEMLMEIESLTELTSYGKAMRFADNELKAKLEGYNNETIYRFAANLQDKSGFGTDIPAQLKETIRLFRSISGYKDADEKAEKCKEKIRIYESGVNRENYKKACDLLKEAEKGGEYQIANYINAVKQFKECGNYSDAADKYIECKDAIYNIADELSNNPTNVHDIDNAILLFQNTFGYKDSVARSKELENKRDDIGRELRKKKIDSTIAGWKEEYQKNKMRINIVAISSVIIIILLIAVPMIADSVKENRQQKKLLNSYNSAVELFNEGNYAEASEIFVTLGDYEDSKNLALESVYQNGLKLAEEKKYSEAAAEFDKNISYKDSYTLSVKYEKYAEAYQFVENGDYSNAQKAFVKLGDEEMVTEIKYAEAVDAMNNGEYAAACTKFNVISGYKDSDEKYKECAYAYAEIQYNDGEYRVAKNFYKKADDYKDSQEKLKITSELADEAEENNKIYKEAVRLLEYNNYLEAAEMFKSLGDYKDSAEKAKEAEQLYQDSLPKIIDGPAEEYTKKYENRFGELTYTQYTYYMKENIDYTCFGNVDLALSFTNSEAENAIEKTLSEFSKYPDAQNAFYDKPLGSGYDCRYIGYEIDNAVFISYGCYLFVELRYISEQYRTESENYSKKIIFDLVTGDIVELKDITYFDLMKKEIVNYSKDYIDEYYSAENFDMPPAYYDYDVKDIENYDWYETDRWNIFEDGLYIYYDNLFPNRNGYDAGATVTFPMHRMEAYINDSYVKYY